MEDFIHYLSILLKYRWLIIATTAIVTFGAIAFCAASLYLPSEKSPLPNKYTATAILLVQKGMEDELSTSIRYALGIGSSPLESSVGFDNGSLILMALQSRSFLDKIIDDLGIIRRYGITSQVKSRSRKLLLANLLFDYNRTTSAITISFTDNDPVFARDLTNRVIALLSEWYAQNIGTSKLRQKQLLEEKVAEVKADIDKLESRLNELQNKYGALTAQDLGISQASTLAALRSQLILKEIDIKNYANSSPRDPKLQQLQEERQNIVDLIKQFQGVPGTLGSSASEKSLPDVQMEFNNLTVELDVQRKIHNTLSHQYEVLKLISNSEAPFQVMELAEVPDFKSSPQRSKIVAEAAAASFFASVALAFLLHGISGIRKSREKGDAPEKGSRKSRD